MLLSFGHLLFAQECDNVTNLAASAGDFEHFTEMELNSYNRQVDRPSCQFFSPDAIINSPGVLEEGGNQYAYLAGSLIPNFRINPEFVTIPVGEFSEGCLMSVSFDYRNHLGSESADGMIEIWGAALPEPPAFNPDPDIPLDYWSNYCPGYDVDINEFVLLGGGINPDYFWKHYELENWSNDVLNAYGETITITHLIIINNNPNSFPPNTERVGAVNIDNIVVTKPCVYALHDITVKPDVNCEEGQLTVAYDICLETNFEEPEGELMLDFSIPNIPGLSYANVQTTGMDDDYIFGSTAISVEEVLSSNCFTFFLILDFDASSDDMEITIDMVPDLTQGDDLYISCVDLEGAASSVFLDCEQVSCICPETNSFSIVGDYLLSDLIANHGWPGDGIIDACISIDGQLTIDVGEIDNPYVISGGEMKMEAGSEIVVGMTNTPMALSLQNITTNGGIHGCNQMWKGIKVLENSTLIMRGCSEADARYGIWPQINSIIDVKQSRFSDNYVGIHFEGDQAFTLETFWGNTFQGVGGFLPPYSGQLPQVSEGWMPYGGIEYNLNAGAISTLTIGVDGGPAPFYPSNQFRNMQNGILVAGDVTLTVSYSIFNNIQPEYVSPQASQQGHGIKVEGNGSGALLYEENIYGLDFNNCKWGIKVNRTKIDVNRVDMRATNFGIWVEMGEVGNTINLTKTRINCKQYGIVLLQNDAVSEISVDDNLINIDLDGYLVGSGIKVFESKNRSSNKCIISNNRITLSGGTNNVLKSYFRGIDLVSTNNWGILFNKINCNSPTGNIGIYHVDGLNNRLKENRMTGIGVVDDEKNKKVGLFVKNATASTYHCNRFKHLHTGLQFSEGDCFWSVIRFSQFNPPFFNGLYYEDNLIIDKQEGQQNQWYGTAGDYSGVAALNETMSNSVFVVQNQQYTVLPQQPSFWPPSIDLPNSIYDDQWFVLDPGIVAPGSISGLEKVEGCVSEVPKKTRITAFDKQLIELPQDNTALTWDARRSLIHKIISAELDLTDNPIVQTFYTTAIQEKLGLYSNSKDLQRKFYDEIQNDVDQLLSLGALRKSQVVDLIAIDSIILFNPSEAFILQRASILDNLSLFNEQILELGAEVKSFKNQRVDETAFVNATLGASEIFETNEQILNEIYLRTIAKGNYDFFESEQSLLFSIANQCPLDGGRVVHQARSLYFLIDKDQVFLNDCIGNNNFAEDGSNRSNLSGEEKKLKRNKSIKNVQIFPNPTSHEIIINLSADQGDEIVLFSEAGKVVFQSNISDLKRELIIETNSIHEGVYFLQIFKEKRIISSNRVVIIH